MVEAVSRNVGQPEAVLADAGYASVKGIEGVEGSGVDAYVSVNSENRRRYDFRPAPKGSGAKPVKHPVLVAMQAKLKTDAGRRMYARRKQTVEPVFGIIKQVLGLRQFLHRGLEKVRAEWELVCLAYNVKRLFVLRAA
jgi:hypothetical protein